MVGNPEVNRLLPDNPLSGHSAVVGRLELSTTANFGGLGHFTESLVLPRSIKDPNPAHATSHIVVRKGLLAKGKPFAFGFTTQWSGGLGNTPAW